MPDWWATIFFANEKQANNFDKMFRSITAFSRTATNTKIKAAARIQQKDL